MAKTQKTTNTQTDRAQQAVAWTLATVLLVALIATLPFCFAKTVMAQDLDYSEITDAILNPDQGFYRTGFVRMKKDGTVTGSYNAASDWQLFHLRVDISDMSGKVNGEKDYKFSKNALQGLDDILSFYKSRGKNVVIRFFYDPNNGGAADTEAEVSMILTHIRQLSKVLNKYPVTLTAIEAGLVGPNGEMRLSKIANKETFNKIIGAWLKYTKKIPILVRRPSMILDYLGWTLNDLIEADNPATAQVETLTMPKSAYRLGLFNDGYLGSGNDLGTYNNRSIEVPFIANQTAHLPYGGEVTIPESTYHDIDKCLPEMFEMNLSYLNYEWNTTVVQTKWAEKSFYTSECGDDELYYGMTAYQYISAHMGYRLVLRNSELTYRPFVKRLTATLTIDNVGFGNLYRNKNLTLYLVDADGKVYSQNAGSYSGGSTLTATAKLLSVPRGQYTVYLGINTLDHGETIYPVRFANDLWNADLCANLIGNITI